jgi:general L-amino acid transport system substrate-binding protein
VDDKGGWKGFDIDICKAIAVAILGSADKVSFNAISWAQRFPALQSGTVDLLTSTTMTMSRDTGLGVQFTVPYFHAADQLLVKNSLGVKNGKELNGATVCMTTGTSTGQLVANYLRGLNIKYTTLAFETTSQAKEAYLAGRCDVFGGLGPVLATMRARDAKDPVAHKILPDLMADEPTVLVIKQNDKDLLNALNYVISALLEAEELGITSKNIEAMRNRPDNSPRVKVLLGETPFIGKQLGWRETWAYEMIKTVGNYGEIYDRNLGAQSPYKMERGLNQLWVHGGLLFPVPLL